MIITCPSCATSHKLPDDDFASDGTIIKCASCNHSWLEARAIEVVDSVDVANLIQDDIAINHTHDQLGDQHGNRHSARTIPNLPVIPQAPDAEYEAARIAKAVNQAEEKRLAASANRRAKLRGWMTLAACIAAPFALFAAFPEIVVNTLPGAIVVYEKAGIEVNIPGFTINNVTHQYVMAANTRVLAIRGDITNVTGREQTAPSLRFALRDKNRNEVYNWSLNSVSRQPLKAGQTTSFLTRVAAPPKLADDFQIRFALKGEIAKTASYESHTNKRTQN